jgi:hypothetical protein
MISTSPRLPTIVPSNSGPQNHETENPDVSWEFLQCFESILLWKISPLDSRVLVDQVDYFTKKIFAKTFILNNSIVGIYKSASGDFAKKIAKTFIFSNSIVGIYYIDMGSY